MENLTTIPNVKTFDFDAKKILYFDNNRNLIIFKNQQLRKIKVFEKEVQELYFNHQFYFNDVNGNGYIICNDLKVKKNDDYILNFQNKKIIVLLKRDSNQKTTSLYDWELDKTIFSIESFSLKTSISETFLYRVLRKEKKIEFFDVKCEVKLWYFSLLSLPPIPKTDVYNKDADWEVKKFIGVLDNKLWIALNHHTIIALDIATGQLKQQISSIPDFNSEWLPSAIPSPESMIITDESNKLFGFMWEFYWEINPKNGLIEFTDLTNYLKEYNIRNDNPNYVLVGDIIYFISQHVSAVGGFNRKTKKLNWHFKFQAYKDGQFPKLKEIKGNEQMLGVLDLDENLYVFENNKPAITHALRA
jgi:hypothetical protein